MREYNCDVSLVVKVDVTDDSAILRCIENHDENGVPQEDVRGGTGWRNLYYDLRTEGDVIEHWVSNAVRNGVDDPSRLDGWGDLEPGVVTVHVEAVYVDGFLTDDTEFVR